MTYIYIRTDRQANKYTLTQQQQQQQQQQQNHKKNSKFYERKILRIKL